MLDDTTQQTSTIAGFSPFTEFIKNDQRACGGVAKNEGNLPEVDSEGGRTLFGIRMFCMSDKRWLDLARFEFN